MKKALCLILTLVLSALVLVGCGDQTADGRPKKKSMKRMPAETSYAQLAEPQEGDPIAIFDTSLGEIRVVLFPQYAPMAVKNFVGLCEQGYYNNTLFHRAVYGFVVQGGDASGTGHQGSSIWDNNPFPSEYSSDLRHFSGALCAANSPEDPISTTSQFYFVQSLPQPLEESLRTAMADAGTSSEVLDAYDAVGGLPYLDYTDTVFGQVYKGMEVVDKIALSDTDETDRPVEEIRIKSVTVSTYGS